MRSSIQSNKPEKDNVKHTGIITYHAVLKAISFCKSAIFPAHNYVIGDWNSEVVSNSVFGLKLSSFCTELGYVITDIDHLDTQMINISSSGSFTYISESHGSISWIDHCVCTDQAHASISAVAIDYDMHSSDHVSLSICINCGCFYLAIRTCLLLYEVVLFAPYIVLRVNTI